MLNTLFLAAVAAAAPAVDAAPARPDPELSPPVRVEAAGKPIESGSVGHAAPFVGDFDGDGVNDLLVGQFEDGKLRVYRNEGTNSRPRFETFSWFLEGKTEGRVPTG